ncbi:hypothetical protein Tco_0617397 [Tanacetum coccineum]
MYRIATSTTQNREQQLPHASRNTNPHVSTSTGVNHSTSVSRPPLKSYQVKDKVVPNNSQVKFVGKYKSKVSIDECKLEVFLFKKSLPSVWHVVLPLIGDNLGLDELYFDDLYNNLKMHDPLWNKPLKARFGGRRIKEEQKKSVENKQFETFTIGSRED